MSATGFSPRFDALTFAGAAAAHTKNGAFAEARTAYREALRIDPSLRDVHLRLYEVEQVLGENAAAIAHLEAALATGRIVTTPASRCAPRPLVVMALMRPALWEGSVPLDLLLDPETTTILRVYLDNAGTDLETLVPQLPPYDLIFNAIGESEAARPALAAAQRFHDRARRPWINDPAAVTAANRTSNWQRFSGVEGVAVPDLFARVRRDDVQRSAPAFPFIIRPVDSQAGIGLARIDDAAGCAAYLATETADEFYVASFVDYASPDGFYRKYRVIFVNGRPYPYHLAVSPRWMIHYYNAPMADHAWMRAEEERFIDAIESVFDGPRRAALETIAAVIGLDYFGIDCAIARDGRVLLFEADAAMLVHATDGGDAFAYKRRAFAPIQRAVYALFDAKIAAVR